jgi:RimJ/RimL family protein N-acetyltransferase
MKGMGTSTPAWPLETERLRLRPFELGDLDVLHEIYSDAGVVRYLYEEPSSRAELVRALERKRARTGLSAEGDGISAAVSLRETGQVVGDVSLVWTSEAHRQAELGFVMHPAWHGRGYATEAARPLLAFAFETLGVHRVIGRLEARNAGSARVLEKLGMRREAHLVENEWVKGEWQSELVYAILDRDWRADQTVPLQVSQPGIVPIE